MYSSLNATTVINLGAEPDAPDTEGKKYKDCFPEAAFNGRKYYWRNKETTSPGSNLLFRKHFP